MIENTIKQIINNPALIKNYETIQRSNGICTVLEIESKFNQVFKIYIENGKAKFFPLNPFG
jgi:hypothetical protein